MTTIEILQWVGIGFLQFIIFVAAWEGSKKFWGRVFGRYSKERKAKAQELTKRSKELERVTIERERAHAEAFKRLTDPKAIQEDMEKSARAREMFDAGRTTLPRDENTPHAVVHRPKLRAPKPGTRTKIYRRDW